MEIDYIDLWKGFYHCAVRYITIGGFAVNFYGFDRSTGDIDFLIENTLDNRKKIRKAFIELGIGNFEQIETMEFLAGWSDFSLGYGMKLDLMTSIMGLGEKSFEELYQSSEVVQIRDIPVRFIDYQNLIATKKATGRPKDLHDIEELEKIKKWRGKKD